MGHELFGRLPTRPRSGYHASCKRPRLLLFFGFLSDALFNICCAVLICGSEVFLTFLSTTLMHLVGYYMKLIFDIMKLVETKYWVVNKEKIRNGISCASLGFSSLHKYLASLLGCKRDRDT